MQRIFNFLTTFVFVIIIFVPGLVMLVSDDKEISETEKRELATAPDLEEISQPETFVTASEAYLNDQFGFREALISLNSQLRAEYFHQSPVDGVLIGKDGWLFLATHDLMADYRGVIEMSESHLTAWENYFMSRQQWLAERDIAYYVVLPPDKHRIYPEYLPDGYEPAADGQTRLDLVLKRMRAHPEVNMIDLRPALLAAKNGDTLYWRTDSHWNYVGGYTAYREIMSVIQEDFPQAHILPESDLSRTTQTITGDLATMMSLDSLYEDTQPVLSILRSERCAKRTDGSNNPYNESFLCPERTLRILIFRDSYWGAVSSYFANSFGATRTISNNLNMYEYVPLIEEYQPDIVIEELVERRLAWDEPQ